MFFLRWTPCGMTGQQKAYWENLSMMMTPLDYWKNGMDLWLRTAEAQMDMTFRMVSLMPSWEVGLMTARGLSDDRVSLRPSKDGKPVLRSVVGTTPQASARKPALKPVAPVAPVVEAMVEAASDIQSAVSDAAEAQVDAASEIRAAMSDVVEAQIDAVAGLAGLLGAAREDEAAGTIGPCRHGARPSPPDASPPPAARRRPVSRISTGRRFRIAWRAGLSSQPAGTQVRHRSAPPTTRPSPR